MSTKEIPKPWPSTTGPATPQRDRAPSPAQTKAARDVLKNGGEILRRTWPSNDSIAKSKRRWPRLDLARRAAHRGRHGVAAASSSDIRGQTCSAACKRVARMRSGDLPRCLRHPGRPDHPITSVETTWTSRLERRRPSRIELEEQDPPPRRTGAYCSLTQSATSPTRFRRAMARRRRTPSPLLESLENELVVPTRRQRGSFSPGHS